MKSDGKQNIFEFRMADDEFRKYTQDKNLISNNNIWQMSSSIGHVTKKIVGNQCKKQNTNLIVRSSEIFYKFN